MGTAVVGIILVVAVAAIVLGLVRNKKKGKHSCGGNCSGCSACGSECPSAKTDALHCIVLEIDGMMCPMCESHVNDAIRNRFPVKSVKSSFKTGICTVTSEEVLDTETLSTAIKETGYTVKKITVIG